MKLLAPLMFRPLGVCAMALAMVLSALSVHAADAGETVEFVDPVAAEKHEAVGIDKDMKTCDKLKNELAEARDKGKDAEALEEKVKMYCKQSFSSKHAENGTPTDSEVAADETEDSAGDTAATAGSNANFGGASAQAEATQSTAAEAAATATPQQASTSDSSSAQSDAVAGTETDVTKDDAIINVDNATTQPEAQKTTVTATDMMNSGKIPDSASERAALVLQYARENGLNEEATQALMRTISRENASLNPQSCNKKSSACGLGQYTDGTWGDRCTQFGSRWSFKAQADCLINDVSNRYSAYTSGKQTCGGRSFDSCNYIQHYAGSYSQKAAQLGYIRDALTVLNDTAKSSASFFANAASALGGGDVASILAAMKTSQDTGLGATVAGMLGYTGGAANATTTSGLVSQLLGSNSSGLSSLFGNSSSGSGNNVIANALNALFSGLSGGSGSSSGGSSSDGSSSSSSSRTLTYSNTDVATNGTITTTKIYSDGYKVVSVTPASGTAGVSAASAYVAKVCGGSQTTSRDAYMLMISQCSMLNDA